MSVRPQEGYDMATPASFDPKPFRDFEQAGWNTTADKYDRSLGSVTSAFSESLLDAAGVQKGTRVLDVATGPGYVASAAATRGAEAIGLDFAPNMVAEARRLHPHVTFQEGDAEALPFPGENFDAVVISFGMLHVSRPELVLAEVGRVLRPGGRLAFTVWGNPHGTAAALGILLRAVETHGTMDVGLPPGPPMFRFSDHNETRRALLEAGFESPHVKDLPYAWKLPNPDALLQYFIDAGVRAGELLRLQSPATFEAIKAFVRNEVTSYKRGGVIAVPMGAVLASAVKPLS
jgi:ubiquinone/menaquinone biosynthesis C-methylase UbiE